MKQHRNLKIASPDPKENYVINPDFAKMRVGAKTLDDAIIKLGTYREVNENYGNKGYILNAIKKHNYEQLRDISAYFYEASGIYQRMCKYLA